MEPKEIRLLEYLYLHLGHGIAKGILKCWLNDHHITLQASNGVLDCIRDRLKNFVDQKSATSRVDEIMVQAAQALAPVLEHTYADLADDTKRMVIDTVKTTLDSLHLTPEMIVRGQMNTDVLLASLLQQAPQLAHEFDRRETQLYHLLLEDALRMTVGILRETPDFEAARDRRILELLNSGHTVLLKIVDELTKIRKSVDPQREAFDFEIRYRKRVADELDHLMLFGLGSRSKRYQLTAAYTTLSVEQEQECLGEDDDTSAQTQIFSAPELLSQSQKLFIRGGPGAGKTTLLQWIAVRAANDDFPQALSNWLGRLPFFIRLREYVGKPLPNPKDFVSKIAGMLGDEMPDQWVQHKLKQQRALILVDGVDEMSNQETQKVAIWVKELAVTYPDNPIIVTGRSHADRGNLLADLGFVGGDLMNMNQSSLHTFIDRWHLAMKETVSDSEGKTLLEQQSKNLKSALESNQPLRRLATNPLLCAMICTLHREDKKLPADRVDLYRACHQMFYKRDSKRGFNLEGVDYPTLNDTRKDSFLSDLALRMVRNKESEASRPDVLRFFQSKLKRMDLKEVTSEGVLNLLVERIGLLREPEPNMIDWPHKTFLEYFAADLIAEEGEGSINELILNAEEETWREVIILTCGIAKKAEIPGRIISGLLDRAQKEQKHASYMILLAASCLEICNECPPDTRTHLRIKMKQVVHPKTLREAALLAEAKDLALPYLDYDKDLNVDVLAARIRTLTLIGGPVAYKKLTGYFEDIRTGVRSHLADTISFSSSPTEFRKHVYNKIIFLNTCLPDPYILPKLTQLKELTIRFISQPQSTSFQQQTNNKTLLYQLLKGEIKLEKLQTLTINTNIETIDLSHLGALKNLKSLNLFGHFQNVTENVPQMNKLKELVIYTLGSGNFLSVFDKWTNTTTLQIIRCMNFSGLHLALRSKSLESITLQDTGGLQLKDTIPGWRVTVVSSGYEIIRDGSTSHKTTAPLPFIPLEKPPKKSLFKQFIPLVDPEIAAGTLDHQNTGAQTLADAETWLQIPQHVKPRRGLFVAKVVGQSMEPKIPDGSYCVFQINNTDIKRSGIVLATQHQTEDPDNGSRNTVKKIASTEKLGNENRSQQSRIELRPLNPDFEPLVINNKEGVRIIAEFVCVLE